MRDDATRGDGVDADALDVDPVTLEVVRNATAAVAEEMNATLVRTAYSPNIKERKDCSCALFDADGAMVSQAENIPVHLGAMPFSVAAAVERFDFDPGDGVLLNDPFAGGAHLPDLTLVSPVFHEGAPVAFAANRAHHADVGGAVGGSVGAESTEIFQEGLRIPPVKLYEAGQPNEAVFDLLLANVRTPGERRGDLRAQQAANETGRRRFDDLADERDVDDLLGALASLQDYAERRMRAEIGDLPDGTYAFADVLESDGAGNEDLPVEAAVTVDGDALHVDFAGTAHQTDGPVNAPFAVTASATYYAVRTVTDPEIPANAGAYRPISLDAPGGSVVNAEPPAAVVGGNLETSQRVVDVLLGAFAEAAPERAAAAGQGTMNNVTFGGTDPRTGVPASDASGVPANEVSRGSAERSAAGGSSMRCSDGAPYTFYETQAGGFGGRAGLDGMDAVHVHMSNTLNTPAEVLETAYPLRVEQYALRPDSAGAGEFRGGLGLRRDVRVRDHRATLSLLAERHRRAPYGLAGGEPGAPGAAEVDGEPVPAKGTHDLPPGALVSIRTPGGGGYGDPGDRDPAAVRRDLRLGKISEARARDVYGVAVGDEHDATSEDDPGERDVESE
jgi:N-methylhydantoinase B